MLEYLPAGFNAEDATQAEIDDVGSLAALASPDVAAARIDRMAVNASTWDMTERLLKPATSVPLFQASDTSTSIRLSLLSQSKPLPG